MSCEIVGEVLGIAGVSPAVFGVPPKTSGRSDKSMRVGIIDALGPVGETPTGATGTVAIPFLTS
jgi:hypothetical protein